MKVGILTHYYQSTNYGGNLQAYALARVIRSLGHDAEVISYIMENWKTIDAPETIWHRIKKLTPKRLRRAIFRRIKNKIWKYTGIENKYNKALRQRMLSFQYFNQDIIQHSEKIYNDLNITESSEIYDAFISGSDQVWNPDCYLKPFYLDFVPLDKKKISYAASVAKDCLSEKELDIFRKSLSTFSAISVRERNSVDLLKRISPIEIHHLLDPTLLIEESEWEYFCLEDFVNEKYLFCYFLGTNVKVYDIIKKFACKRRLKIVNIPFMADEYLWRNEYLGDINIIDAGPEKFLTLIKHASYIFTDSYHALIFSFIFKKQFFVFNRNIDHDINTRIYDLLEILELTERFCDTREKERYQYISNVQEIKYEKEFVKLEIKKIDSINFLRNNLK